MKQINSNRIVAKNKCNRISDKTKSLEISYQAQVQCVKVNNITICDKKKTHM